MMKTISGKVCKATVIKKSVSAISNDIMTTFELEYPRFIHSEFMTHRMLSKNASSSRAIPFNTMTDNTLKGPAIPSYWGKNQSGMQAKEELGDDDKTYAKTVWLELLDHVAQKTRVLNERKLHKQTINRLTEPWQMMKTVVSGTEFANLYWLRDHVDAQPEFNDLVVTMQIADAESKFDILHPGEWHLPYVELNDKGQPIDSNGEILSIEDAIKVSASCCAQVSYRKNDDSLEKALDIYNKLIESEPCHASPIEHQATPIDEYTLPFEPSTWQEGITHVRRDGSLWSANLQGWVQYRQLIPGNTKW